MLQKINYPTIFNSILMIWIISIPFKNAFYQISTGLIVLNFIIYVFLNKDFFSLRNLLLKYKDLILATLLIILSMTISNLVNDVSKVKAWNEELNFFYRYILIFFILIYFYSKNFFSKKLILIFVLTSLSIQSIDSIYQAITGFDLFKNKAGSLKGLTAATFNRNVFGMIMGAGVLISLLIFEKKKIFSTNNILISLLLISFSFGTLFSYTRSTWVSLFFVLILYIFINFKKLSLRHVYLLLSLIILISLLFYNIDSLFNRFMLLINGSSSGRDKIWSHAIELIIQKPYLGWGLDSWRIHGTFNLHGLHNSILEILFLLGLFGFSVFLYLNYLVFKTIYLQNSYELFYISIYFFILSLFEQSVTHGTILLSCLVILMFYIFSSRIEHQER